MKFMLQTRSRRFTLYGLTIVAGMVASCLVLAAIGHISNQKLPSGPEITDRLEPLDKIRLAEALHLKAELGDTVWPGYSALNAPVIIWNEDYEFLFGVGAAPMGWTAVTGDDFDGMLYYRRPANDPQNFAVKVGHQWTASVFTKYELDANLINAIREIMPPIISDIFPYRIIIQPSELQISGVQHEYFHVLQALDSPAKFAEAETIYGFEDQYWAIDGNMHPAWDEEIQLLIKAVEASSDNDAAEYGLQFLAQRDRRRQDFDLNADLVAYEEMLEWLEGTAKYMELRLWQEAGRTPGYAALVNMLSDPDFENYEDFNRHWSQEIRQTRRQGGEEGDVRFYYTGMLQAYLLDRLMPNWKARIIEEGVYLDDLLREAVAK